MSQKQTAPGPRYESLLQLLRTSESIWNASRVFFARWDLSPSQFNILNLLRDFPDGLPQVELSRLLITHRSNMTGLIDRLEKRGLVERHDDPLDRRAYKIVMTEKGREVIFEILPHYYETAEAIWAGFDMARCRSLSAELKHLESSVLRMQEKLEDSK